MQYGIIGATGPTGLELTKQLAKEQVSVYVRNSSRITPRDKLRITQGELQNERALKEWASQNDVVFCTLGHTDYGAQLKANLGLSSYKQSLMMSRVIKTLLEARVKRIIHCSAYGTRETREDLPFFFGKILLPLLIKESYLDHEAVETLLETSGTEWVVARPGMLTNGPLTGKYRVQLRFQSEKALKISRADVAHFMIKAANTDEFSKKCWGLGY